MKKNQVDPGLTYLDDTPVEIPLRVKKAAMEGDRFMDLVRRFSEFQREQGNESLEESDDFEVGDDDEFHSPYEMSEMQEEGEMDDASFRAKRGKFFPGHKRTESVHKKDFVDRRGGREYSGDTVNRDRIKENRDVRENRAGDDREGAGDAGEERSSSRRER